MKEGYPIELGIRSSIVIAVAIFDLCAGVPGTSQAGITTIALTGDASPDGDGVLDTLDLPVLNDSGGSANEGVYLADNTTVEVLAHHGDDAPGGGVFREFLQPVLIEVGQVAFHARLEGIGAGPQGIYLADTSSVVAVVLEDQRMPDGDGVLAPFNQLVLNDAGAEACAAGLGWRRRFDNAPLRERFHLSIAET